MIKKIMNSKITFALVILLIIVVLGYYISTTLDYFEKPIVTLSRVLSGTIDNSYNVTSYALQKANVNIYAEEEIFITDIEVAQNTKVNQGDILAITENGVITSPCNGTVLSVLINENEPVASEKLLFKLAETNSDVIMDVTVPLNKAKAFTVGDLVTVNIMKNNRMINRDASITGVTVSSDFNSYIFEITLPNENGEFIHGDRVELNFKKQSEIYPCIVLRSALIASSNNIYYIYIAEPTNKPNEYYVTRYEVSILADNGIYAAISRNFPADSLVVTSTTSPLGLQTTVRTE